MSFIAGTMFQWLGQACFFITTLSGCHILIDPCNPAVGYPLNAHSVAAHIVFVSHNHSDHNFIEMAKKPEKVVRPLETPEYEDGYYDYQPGYEKHRISYRSIFSYHDQNEGKDRGTNTIRVIEVDGLRICHLGDLGQKELTPRQLELIGKVDVLMIPVGGFYTIDAKQAAHVTKQLKPKIIFPMHYQTQYLEPNLRDKLAPVTNYIHEMGSYATVVNGNITQIPITAGQLPEHPQIVVLQFSKPQD
jgi:L-ascorbate metabolism protein UlaG (beta-lactamase superfamily)